jgi:two-component system nitrate/nitrite response regulator NarL
MGTVSKISVALIDDDAPYRAYVSALIEASGRYALVAQAGSVEEAATWSAKVQPALLLLDVAMPGVQGPAAVGRLLAARTGLKIVMLTGRDADEPLLEAIRAGAVGYLLKGAGSAEIVEALDDAVAGGAPMSPSIAKRVLTLLKDGARGADDGVRGVSAGVGAGAKELAQLTEREREVLARVAAGDADKEICEKLGVTRSTVKNHLTSIYDKWRVRSRTQAAVRFVKVTGK